MPDVPTVETLVKTRWTFGGVGIPPVSDRFGFGGDGKILYYSSPNEHSWTIEDDVLLIYRRDGSLMWRSLSFNRGEDGWRIVLQASFDTGVQWELTETALEKKPQGIGDADYLTPKDLRLTETVLKRVLIIGSCLSAHFKVEFESRARDTGFDFMLFNYVQNLTEPPVPIEEYSMVLLQLPLHFILTERVVRATECFAPGYLETLYRDACVTIDAMLDAALSFNRTSGILTLVANFIVPQAPIALSLKDRGTGNDVISIVRRLNDYLGRAIAPLRNVYLLDIDGAAAIAGKRYVLDDMISFYLHNSVLEELAVDIFGDLRAEPVPAFADFYPSKRTEFFDTILDQMIGIYRTVQQVDQVKAVVFDLDNTMWRGQIAEHYRPGVNPEDAGVPRHGWPTGLGEVVQHLRARGILVAICSKNDLRTVEDRWDIAVDPLWMKLSDFVSVKVNWRSKADNIVDICREFMIKPKSLVFVDDHPAERAAVKAALPDVRVMGGNPYLTRRILLWSPETQVATLSNESVRREDMVRSQIEREEVRTNLSREEFLESLGCAVSFVSITDMEQKEAGRVFELVNKTNQFNTTGQRWTDAEIRRFFTRGGSILAFRARDRFADYGLVGALFTNGPEIVQYVMSCRVLGMEIETYVLARVVEQLRVELPGMLIRARVRETEDNGVCRDVFAGVGFRVVSREGGESRWEIEAGEDVRVPGHIRLAV
jgi:FkbH-like protein